MGALCIGLVCRAFLFCVLVRAFVVGTVHWYCVLVCLCVAFSFWGGVENTNVEPVSWVVLPGQLPMATGYRAGSPAGVCVLRT